MNSEYTYQPSDVDDEIFLADVPANILISSIETQFNEPLEYRKKDYIQSFITKFEMMRDNTPDDLDNGIDEIHDSFFAFVENIFYEKLGVGFTNIDDMSYDDMHELVHMTYRFFIKNIKKNFVNIVKNYINENEGEISSNFERKRDVTSLNFKSELTDDYDILVISELGNIIDYIFNRVCDFEIDEFFEYCDDGEYSLELDFVRDAFDKDELTGNFIYKYISMVDPEFKVEIQAKIRNKILKKYPKRERPSIVQDEEIENNDENEIVSVPNDDGSGIDE